MVLVAIPFGLAIGIALGMLGGGGSVLAVPVLVYVLGQSVHQATTASLVVVTAGALAGGARPRPREPRLLAARRRVRARRDPRHRGWNRARERGQRQHPDRRVRGDHARSLPPRPGARPASAPTAASARSPTCPPLRQSRTLAAGLLIGALTGFFGVGGGFLIVPTLTVFLALSMRLAIGTSLAIITATSALALTTHLLTGRGLDIPVTVAMTAACVVGALAGTSLAGRVPQRQLGHGFATMVATVAGYLIISAAFLGGPPGS